MALVPQNRVTQLYLVVDSKIIHMGTPSILQGLNLLFKSYHTFNVEYPLGWKPFWELIERGVFNINKENLSNAAFEILKCIDFSSDA